MAGVGNAGLTCPVCYNSYQTNEESRVPRSLNCGHTYCTGCLEKLMSERSDTVIIRCPTCKRETVLMSLDHTHSLPKNYGLLEVVSLYEKDEAHLKESETASAPLSTEKPVCSEHDEPMKVYCHTDECLICIYCQVYGTHAGHNCELLCELVKAKKESIADVYRHCMQSLRSLLQAKTHNDESFACIRRKENVLEEKINKHFHELHCELEKREECLKRRINTKIREQAITLLTHERMLHDLIHKGNELRKRCSKLLKSSDYAVLAVEKGNISDLVDELWNVSSSCDSNIPKPSSQLSWDFDEELVDVIKLHGQIVEKTEQNLSGSIVPDIDQATDGQFHEDVVETLDKMFDTGSAEHEVIAPTEVALDPAIVDPLGVVEIEFVGHYDTEDLDEPYEMVEDAAGLVDLAQGNSTLINELRSEMRREIQRLKNVAVPVTIEILSDSSFENEDREGELSPTTGPATTGPATTDQQEISDRIRELSLQSQQIDHATEHTEREQEPQQERRDPLLHNRRHHHHHDHHKHHASQVNKHQQCEPRNAATGLRNVPHKCHRPQPSSLKHGHHTRHTHQGQRKHYHVSCLALHRKSKKTGHGDNCQAHHMVSASGNQHTAKPSNLVSDDVVATFSDIICPMCTLANEAGKDKCELCGFNLTE